MKERIRTYRNFATPIAITDMESVFTLVEMSINETQLEPWQVYCQWQRITALSYINTTDINRSFLRKYRKLQWKSQ